ncbi:unnamed protein product [Taenia asiatica]|uniref:Uncharacterized protein n=1 Tax=Taenia asiatica TaxID=60517 RepID=A0A0R3WE57_TAEAS|nr:unnamed protein product [Taenia asiatica]
MVEHFKLPDSETVHSENRYERADLAKKLKEIDRSLARCTEMELYMSTQMHYCADLFLLKKDGSAVGKNTQSADSDTALVHKRFLTSSYKPTVEEVNSFSKTARRIWQK